MEAKKRGLRVEGGVHVLRGLWLGDGAEYQVTVFNDVQD
jgi:hypothetical protein